MANMSYCRFRNTLSDLHDCAEALHNGDAENSDLSSEERAAKDRLIVLCHEIAEDYFEEED